ncbi:MAG: four helix bundle protein [Oligoflexia bacterium]|nr:four helix bundle protein [Oligoflexia bacterium]
MLKKFKSYQLAVELHQQCLLLKVPSYLKDQLFRASSSVALNLAEGSAKPTNRDKIKFYYIALGSLRETQASLEFICSEKSEAVELADKLGAHIYKLIQAKLRARKW